MNLSESKSARAFVKNLNNRIAKLDEQIEKGDEKASILRETINKAISPEHMTKSGRISLKGFTSSSNDIIRTSQNVNDIMNVYKVLGSEYLDTTLTLEERKSLLWASYENAYGKGYMGDSSTMREHIENMEQKMTLKEGLELSQKINEVGEGEESFGNLLKLFTKKK